MDHHWDSRDTCVYPPRLQTGASRTRVSGLQLAGMVSRRQWSFLLQHSQSMREAERRGFVKGPLHDQPLMK